MAIKKSLLNSSFDPLDQLSLLKDKCNNISPLLYRVNYLYLEEVRKFLPQAIRTSLLSLITDRLGDDFGFSTVTSRKRFQLKIDKLVSNAIALLTIEHLNELIKKMDEEKIRQLNNAKDEIANTLNSRNNSEQLDTINHHKSISISTLPPLDNLSITEGWNVEIKTPYSIDNKEYIDKVSNNEKDYLIDSTQKEDENLKNDDKNFDGFHLKSNDFDILQSIFSLNDESALVDLDAERDNSSSQALSSENFKNNRLLPQSPIGLYEWMVSLDVALIRRLRDLSHSINTELLKSGLVNTLVPINILDAALSGQLITSKSISNILSLKLPTNSTLGSSGLDVECILITPSDMEFDNPKIRKNRMNIKYYQNVLLGMIKQQRYWQARNIAEEVNKEWWKDTTKI